MIGNERALNFPVSHVWLRYESLECKERLCIMRRGEVRAGIGYERRGKELMLLYYLDSSKVEKVCMNE